MSELIRYKKSGNVAVLRLKNPPVNALSQPVRQALADAMNRAEADKDVVAVLIVGEGRAFIAGADIKEFGKPPIEPMLPGLCDRIEQSTLLVVASMHGVSLGGGLEVALACHYRIAHDAARVGLPEVNIGLIPGAGGTQRLPRLIGVRAALEAITTGRQIGAREALDLGIIDRVFAQSPLEAGLEFVDDLLTEQATPRPIRDLPAPAPVDWEDAHAAVAARAHGQLSPSYALRAVRAGTEMSFVEGLSEERRLFDELMQTNQRKGLIHAFFAERQVARLPEIRGVTPREISSIGVVGGGAMGSGIAASALIAGLDVRLLEQDSTTASTAEERVAQLLDGAVSRGKLAAEIRDAVLAERFSTAIAYAALSPCDVVIEAVFEDMAVKKSVFVQLDEVCKPGAILASNTSYLDIGEMARGTARPGDVLGLHFFSPAHVMKLVEVVDTGETSPDVLATGFALAKRLGKIAVRAGICDGFIGNRIMTAYRTVADHMVLEGATPWDVDAAIKAFGFAMGPFAVADLAGLDIGWAARKRRAPTLDRRARIATYPDRLCAAGHFGRKTGAGFYLYPGGAREGVPNQNVQRFILEERRARGIIPRSFDTAEIQHRFVAAMVNEGARLLSEGIARRPLDIDV
ncbi:MAG: 3-hydroxyacyl-CoA dehydrogenase NAD-binding domain-containing protein, partial [Pseudomonadota bacterium]